MTKVIFQLHGSANVVEVNLLKYEAEVFVEKIEEEVSFLKVFPTIH